MAAIHLSAWQESGNPGLRHVVVGRRTHFSADQIKKALKQYKMKKLRRRRGYMRSEPLDPELLRSRAKTHIAHREWHKAMACLNETLTEPDNHPVGEDFVPNKQSLVMRGRIHLILNHKEEALQDALMALDNLEVHNPAFAKALNLRADALFQMGRFEHALLFYHKGYQLKERSTEHFRLGIHKATEAIVNSLKSLTDVGKAGAKGQWQGKVSSTVPRPFRQDISELKKILGHLQRNQGPASRKLEKATNEALSYIRERNQMWKEKGMVGSTSAASDNDDLDQDQLFNDFGEKEMLEEKDESDTLS